MNNSNKVKLTGKILSQILCACGLVGLAMNVTANLAEPAVYDLMGPTGTSVLVCGTNSCDTEGDDAPFKLGTRNATDDGYAIFSVFETGPAGSGLIRPFLRFQHNDGDEKGKGKETIERAYNTDNNDLQTSTDGGILGPKYDYVNKAKDTTAGPGDDFNHAILFSNLVEDGGYFTFLLDINEPNEAGKSLLRLDELSFFISDSNMLGVYADDECISGDSHTSGSEGCFLSADNNGADTEKVWDMDLDAAIGSVMLDNVNDGSAGSGDYDLSVKLSASLFDNFFTSYAGAATDFYVYLENTAGLANPMEGDVGVTCNRGGKNCTGGEAEAGFEEWAAIERQGPDDNGVPIPSTAFLVAIGGLALIRRRFN